LDRGGIRWTVVTETRHESLKTERNSASLADLRERDGEVVIPLPQPLQHIGVELVALSSRDLYLEDNEGNVWAAPRPTLPTTPRPTIHPGVR
jgi:hypothetical protein